MRNGSFDGFGVAFNPEVHAVAGDNAGTLDLFQNAQLQFGIDVAEKHILRRAVGLRNNRLERLKDIELGIECFGLIQVVAVFAVPPERLALNLCQAGRIDLVFAKDLKMFVRKSLSTRRRREPEQSNWLQWK